MTTEEILSLGQELPIFLDEFSACFGRSEPRQHVADYIRGQMSDLPRKSVERIADFAGKPPRTMQELLRTDEWDHLMMRDRCQQMVLRDHFDPQGIGVFDSSEHSKKGNKTACVARMWCGRSGKVENCVSTVHLSYTPFDMSMRVMLDSTPYLPKPWHEDRQRCRAAGIPDEVVYRSKYDIGLEQYDRALANGLTFGWVVADAWFGEKPRFLDELESRSQRFVLEIPHDLRGWSFDPGPSPRYPARKASNICRHAISMLRQPWTQFYIKDTNKGAVVWEVKATPFWRKSDRRILGPYWLIWCRNVLNPGEEKYLLSNAAPGTPLEVILHVGFGRWPVERCLQDEKSQLGLSHFEVRNYQSLCRHLLITQASHLFLVRQTMRLREKKSGDYGLPSTRGDQRPPGRPAVALARTSFASRREERTSATPATPQRRGSPKPRQSTPSTA